MRISRTRDRNKRPGKLGHALVTDHPRNLTRCVSCNRSLDYVDGSELSIEMLDHRRPHARHLFSEGEIEVYRESIDCPGHADSPTRSRFAAIVSAPGNSRARRPQVKTHKASGN